MAKKAKAKPSSGAEGVASKPSAFLSAMERRDEAELTAVGVLEVLAAWPIGLRSDDAQAMQEIARRELDKFRK
jgi:hypothetical protein